MNPKIMIVFRKYLNQSRFGRSTETNNQWEFVDDGVNDGEWDSTEYYCEDCYDESG
jgi:hypothetical protein